MACSAFHLFTVVEVDILCGCDEEGDPLVGFSAFHFLINQDGQASCARQLVVERLLP